MSVKWGNKNKMSLQTTGEERDGLESRELGAAVSQGSCQVPGTRKRRVMGWMVAITRSGSCTGGLGGASPSTQLLGPTQPPSLSTESTVLLGSRSLLAFPAGARSPHFCKHAQGTLTAATKFSSSQISLPRTASWQIHHLIFLEVLRGSHQIAHAECQLH